MHHQFSGQDDAHSSAAFPSSRRADLAVTEADDEAVIYEATRHEIHRLNPTALAIWKLSDGTRSAQQVSEAASSRLGAVVDERAVRLAWTLMDDRHLLNAPLAAELHVTKTRRSFLKGVLAAGVAAAPLIVSITAPQAAAAASQGCKRNGNLCSSDAECCSGWCYEGFCMAP